MKKNIYISILLGLIFLSVLYFLVIKPSQSKYILAYYELKYPDITKPSGFYEDGSGYYSYDFHLILTKNKKYILVCRECMRNFSPDGAWESMLSFGDYRIKGTHMILTDEINRSQTICKIEKSSLFILRGLWFSIGQKFIKQSVYPPNWDEIGSIQSTKSEINIYDSNVTCSNVKSPEILIGKYQDISACEDEFIEISQDSHYELYFKFPCEYVSFDKPILLSKGTWKTDKNRLRLEDKMLNCTFSLFWSNDTLFSITRLPGRQKSNTFKLVQH